MFNFMFFLILIVSAYAIGSYVEIKHYRDIKKRELEYMRLPVVTSKDIEQIKNIEEAGMVYGSVVISLDYFKRFFAGLQNFFGGRILVYESLLERGRREAILRMKQQARTRGFDVILNMRFGTSLIAQITARKNNNIGCFEVLAYGTAVKLKK